MSHQTAEAPPATGPTPAFQRVQEFGGFPGAFRVFDSAGAQIAVRYTAGRFDTAAAARAAAARMSYADQMGRVLRMADMDFEMTGAVSLTTIGLVRCLLASVAAA